MSAVRDAILDPRGHQQIVNPVASTALTIPAAGASYALLNCTAGADGIRLTGDGATTPTAAIGIKLELNAKLWWAGDLRSVRVIRAGVGGADTLDIEYFA